ncbi:MULTISPECIES: inovirus-type Gp2 protein [Pandoraea]|uniref:Inovirus Gp2 family protein n=1 Tax=Pandoraea communis TaxID=2508297 RepID=A0A5E4XYH3_9BURK|nr:MULTISPECIES: inovirus-type Gp2 protein [Pandoraea]CFB61444.1 hypothetical protein LMG16407_01503 [Pandoraea apista]VVE41108.1 hypothetical protein PCO31110_04213 [Pandoraea communis]
MFQNTTPFNPPESSPFTQWDDRQVASPSRYWEVGEYAKVLNQLDSFLAGVLRTTQVPFDIRIQWGREVAVRNPVGVYGYRSLVGFLPSCARWMDLYRPGYHYSADLQLFFDCFRQHPFAGVFSNGVLASPCDQVYVAKLYNDFVGCLRIEAIRRGVKKRLCDWRANLKDQEQAIRRYVAKLQAAYPSLHQIRCDLHYTDYAMSDADTRLRTSWALSNGNWLELASNVPSGHGRPETAARFDPAIAMADRDRFFDNQRGADNDLFEPMVGYICKMEQGGIHRANHFHCVFFFDATRVTQAQVEGFKCRIEDRWRKVTRGHGLTFDCHEGSRRAELEAQGRWVLNGLNRANPAEASKFVEYLVCYLTKDKMQMLRIKPAEKACTLTMGH